MGELIEVSQTSVVVESYREHPLGVEFFVDTPLQDWIDYGVNLYKRYGEWRWRFGDWYNFGEHRYGEMASAALQSDLSYQSHANAAWVARRIPLKQRRRSLPWSWHAEVASLEYDDRQRLLNLAELKKANSEWDRDDLRQAVREIKGIQANAPKRKSFTVSSTQALAGELYDVLGAEKTSELVAELQQRVGLLNG